MEEIFERLVELNKEITYKFGTEAYEIRCKLYDIIQDGRKQVKNNVVLGGVSESDSSDFELQRLYDWLRTENREPAQTKFTAGMTRNVAREFEYLLKH